MALFLLRVAIGAVFGGPAEGDPDIAVYLTQYLFDTAVLLAMFARMAQVQIRLPYVHAFAVAVLQECLGFALLFAIGADHLLSPRWLTELALLLVFTWLGTLMGQRLRVAAGKEAGPV